MTTLKYTSVIVAFSFLLAPLVAEEETRTTLALWTFEEWTAEHEAIGSNDIGPAAPEIGSGSFYGYHSHSSTNWEIYQGHGSDNALRANRWTKEDYYEFTVSTLGFESIQLDWNMTRSTTGPEPWKLSYSVNGVDFKDFDTFVLGTSEWRPGGAPPASTYSFDLSGITEINNQPNAFFRLTADDNGDHWQGIVRIDNFSVTAIPEPKMVGVVTGLIAIAGVIGCRIRRRRTIAPEIHEG